VTERDAPRERRQLSRRVVIGGMVGGTAALVAGGFGIAALADQGTTDPKPGPDLEPAIGSADHAALQRVGRRYLEVEPGDSDPARLARALDAAGIDRADAGVPSGLRAAAIRDYRSGDTVLLDGWLISRTEARYAALLTFRPS
jgi:hypothetical protein